MDLRKALKHAMEQQSYGSGIVGGRRKMRRGGCSECGHCEHEGLEDMVSMYLGNGIVGGARGRPLGSKNKYPRGQAPKRQKKEVNPHLVPYMLANKAIKGKKFTNAAAKSEIVSILAGLYNDRYQDAANVLMMKSALKEIKAEHPESFMYKPRKRKAIIGMPDIIE